MKRKIPAMPPAVRIAGPSHRGAKCIITAVTIGITTVSTIQIICRVVVFDIISFNEICMNK